MKNKISFILDGIAGSLELKGFLKEAYELDKIADQLDKEASIASFFKSLISKIPGFPSPEQAAETLKAYKNKSEFKQIVEGVFDTILSAQTIPKTASSEVTAIDVGFLFKNLKKLADPKIIMSIIVLAGVFGSANANDFIKSVNTSDTQQQSVGQDLPSKINTLVKPRIIKNPTSGSKLIISITTPGQPTTTDTLGVDLGLDNQIISSFKGIAGSMQGGSGTLKNMIKEETYKKLMSDANIGAFVKQLKEHGMNTADFDKLLDSHLTAIFK